MPHPTPTLQKRSKRRKKPLRATAVHGRCPTTCCKSQQNAKKYTGERPLGRRFFVIFINYPCSTMSGVEWTVAACKNRIAATPMGEQKQGPVWFQSMEHAWSISGTVFLFSHQCHFFYMLSSSLIVCLHFCIFIGKFHLTFRPEKTTARPPHPPAPIRNRRFQASVDQLKALQLRCPFHLPALTGSRGGGRVTGMLVMLSPMKTYRYPLVNVNTKTMENHHV